MRTKKGKAASYRAVETETHNAVEHGTAVYAIFCRNLALLVVGVAADDTIT
jgi:hypothetical protein